MTTTLSAAIKMPRRLQQQPAKSFGAIATTLLMLAGIATPAVAQPPAQPVADAQLDSRPDIQQIVDQMIAVETQSWSPAQKSALQTLDAMALKDSELAAIAALSASDLRAQLKTDKKLAKLNATGLSSEEMLKLAPTLLLSRYLLNIGRAAVWGGVVSAIRSADFDYRALSSALTTGDTSEFVSLLGQGLRGQDTFVNLVGTAATFACGSATLDFTPGLCDRFASGLQKVFSQVERSAATPTRSRARSLVLDSKAKR
ncbi:MAG: hypothetical protein WA984_19195 [Phormidesmis sp.]